MNDVYTWRMEKLERRRLRVVVPMSQTEVDEIDDWRFQHRMSSRAEAIRQMLRKVTEGSSSDGEAAMGTVLR